MPDEDPRPFDMDAIDAAVDAMTPSEHAAALAVGEEVAAELHEAGQRPRRWWVEVPVEEAVNLCLPRPDIVGPVDEEGQECPWPWKPQQLVGAPLGQHHCEYCGAMVLAGVAHLDYSGKTYDRPPDHWINEDRFAQFRSAYARARSHYSLAAESFAKIDVIDAYYVWRTIQDGMEKPWPE